MKPIWVIENDVFDDGNPDLMAQAASELGLEVRRASYLPFDYAPPKHAPEYKRSLQRVKDELPENACVIYYGSLNGCRWVINNTGWTPGVWFDFNKLRCQVYYAYYGKYLLNNRYVMMPLNEVKRRKAWLYAAAWGRITRRIFIRPDDNAKSFAGEVVAADQFDKWWDVANFYNPGLDCLTVVAPTQEILQEWRVVIADGEPLTATTYRKDGEIFYEKGAPSQVLQFCRRVIEETSWTPSPVFTMDVCFAEDDFRLVEIGGFNGAGLYNCDISIIVKKLSEIAERLYKEDYGKVIEVN